MDAGTNEWKRPEEGKPIPSTMKSIDDVFKYHKPSEDQQKRYVAIRNSAKKFAEIVLENTPKSADQTDSIRKIREAVMVANASIALE